MAERISPRRLIWVIAVLDILAFTGGIALSFWTRVGFGAATGGSLFFVAAITFLGMLALTENMKDSIASSFVVVYFALLVTVVFAKVEEKEGSLGSQILTHFTTLTGVVVGSYFAATAIERLSDNKTQAPTPAKPGEVESLKTNTFGTRKATARRR